MVKKILLFEGETYIGCKLYIIGILVYEKYHQKLPS